MRLDEQIHPSIEKSINTYLVYALYLDTHTHTHLNEHIPIFVVIHVAEEQPSILQFRKYIGILDDWILQTEQDRCLDSR